MEGALVPESKTHNRTHAETAEYAGGERRGNFLTDVIMSRTDEWVETTIPIISPLNFEIRDGISGVAIRSILAENAHFPNNF